MKKMKSSFFFSYTILIALIIAPASVFAQTSDAQTILQLQTQLASLQAAVNSLLALQGGIPSKPTEPPGQAKKATSTPPAIPAIPAQPATPAEPHPGTGQSATPAQSAIPAESATPALNSTALPNALSPEAQTAHEGAVKKLQDQIQPLRQKVEELRQAAVERIQSQLESLQTKLSELVSRAPAIATESSASRILKRGSSGNDVKQLQEFLKQFPDIYLQGSVTGFFGPASEKGVKKLQEKLGIETTGTDDLKTNKKLNELSKAVSRKHQPKINDISPKSTALNEPITVNGSGFTLTENKIMVRGRIVAEHIASPDGTLLKFALPQNSKCGISQACPIKVVNTNGISNAKPIKIIEAIPPPSITPPPPTNQDVTPPVRSNGAPVGVQPSGITSVTLAVNTDENAICKYSTVAGTSYDAMRDTFYNDTWLQSKDGTTYHYSGISDATGLPIITVTAGSSYTYYVRCKDNAGNINADDYPILFSVASKPLPPTITGITQPFGAVGTYVTLTGTGFTATGNSVNFGGTNNAVANLSSQDGKTIVFAVPGTIACQPIQLCSVSVTNGNGTSNVVSFTLLQIITPVAVVSPNGGEKFLQGSDYTIRWSGGTHRVDIVLVGEGATLASDPSDLLVGYLAAETAPDGTVAWNGKRACDRSGTTCFDVTPGNYKILAVSEDEFGELKIWDAVINKPGNIDLSDSAFTVLPSPSLAVVMPNGGESFIRGSAATILWQATSITSRLVNINLWKGGVFLKSIAVHVPLSSDAGLFTYSWLITSDIPFGSDYTVEVVDALNPLVKDQSDLTFSVVSGNKITVLSPNGGETWVQGLKGQVFWYASTTNPVTVNLWKGGAFYMTLATNVPASGFSGYTFQMLYKWPARYFLADIPADIPEGTDYKIELVDSAENIRDVSDTAFRIISLPNPVTESGRFIDHFTQKPLVGAYLGGYGTQVDGSSGKLASTYTDSNGAFSLIASTTDMLARNPSAKAIYGTWPSCYISSMGSFSLYYSAIYASYNKFDPTNPPDWTKLPDFMVPIYSSQVNFGDMPFWPAVSFQLISDIPVKWWVRYPELGTAVGYSLFSNSSYSSNILPLNYNVRAELTDQGGVTYYSPYINLSLDYGCASKTLSYFGGKFQWEPYNITVSASIPYYATGGASYKATLSANGGAAPYIWGILSGSLPPGLSLDSGTGIISGTPATVGTYSFQIAVVDANGVHSGYGYGKIVVK